MKQIFVMAACLGSAWTMSASSLAQSVPPTEFRLLEPEDGAEMLHSHPHFMWSKLFEPDIHQMQSYEVRIASDPACHIVVDEDIVAATVQRYVPEAVLAPGRYFWVVRGLDYNGKVMGVSEIRSFRIERPERVYPVPLKASEQAISDTIMEASRNAPCIVRFAQGTYRIRGRDSADTGRALITLDGVDGMVIDGGGSEIVFHEKHSFLRARNCANIEFKNFIFDHDPLPYTAGTIQLLNRQKSYIEMETCPGHLKLEHEDVMDRKRMLGMVQEGRTGHARTHVLSTHPFDRYERLGAGRYRIWFSSRTHLKDNPIEIGDVFIVGPRGPGGFDLEDCDNVTISDIVAYSAAGIGFPTHNANRLKILRVRFLRKAGRFKAVQNGGNNHHNARIGPWVERCIFESTGDDMLHVNTTTIHPVSKQGLRIAFPRRDIRPGDSLHFYNFFNQKNLGVRRVEGVEHRDRTTEVTLDWDVDDITIPEAKGTSKRDMYKRFTSVYHLDAVCNQFVWRRNVCRNGRQKGLLFKGCGGLVEDSEFENLGGQAFIAINTPLEGFYARDWVIQRNKITNCGINRIKKSPNAVLRIERYGANADFRHENILFRDNVIDGYKDTAVLVEGVDNLVIKDNTFRNSRWEAFEEDRFSTKGYYMVFEEGRNITISGNTHSDIRPISGTGILVKGDVEQFGHFHNANE